jgi:hypothetical protein
MALPGTGVVNRGLQVLVGIAFGTADAFATIQSGAVDDNASNFAAADTALNTSRGAVTNVLGKTFSPTPTRASQTVTFIFTLATADFNTFTVKGISIHNVTGASVTASSTSLVAGIAVNQSISKTSSFALAITGTMTLSDNTP